MKNIRKIAAITTLLSLGTVNAGQLNLSNVPLFAATNAPPANIMFVFDDSGSMDWGTVTNENNGVVNVSGCSLVYTHPTPEEDEYRNPGNDSGDYKDYNGYYPLPPEETSTGLGFWRGRTHHYNKLYYNPAVTYAPWKGKNTNGTPYADANPSAALINPYNPSAGSYDLTADTTYYRHSNASGYRCQFFGSQTSYYPSRYWRWSDSNSDGIVDISDGHNLVEIRSSTALYSGEGREGRSDCADAENGNCTGSEELQNFANWFQYYRRREFTAKAAYTLVVDEAGGVNMGLVSLHNNNNIKHRLQRMSIDANKTSLLDSLSRINARNGTPLRSASYNAYEYMACETNNHFSVSGTECPQATAAEGGACQQSFLVAMTDGFYNGSFSMPGTDNEDDNGDTVYDGGEYGDDYGNTLADIAMEFYEHDIAATLPNVLPVILGIDEARHQHVNTYTVAFGVNGTLSDMPAVGTNGNNYWPDPGTGNAQKIDDLRHAAFNGRGLFLNANSPDELVDSLSRAILSIGDRASSAASVALNSSSLNSGSHVFQARFDSGDWSGQLLSFPISDGKGSQAGCSGVVLGELCPLSWDAGEVLKTQSWDNGREIITLNPSTRTTGISFVWDNLHSSQQSALRKHPDNGNTNSVNQGKRRWRFVRGREYANRSDFRLRSSPLGDIVNSDPFFVGRPRFPYAFNGYPAFRTANVARERVVYVGSNDGMLHAFAEDDGEELLAYIPGDRRVIENLSQLTSLSYATKHKYFVDGSPTIGDVYDGTNGTSWKTILVGGLRAGGQSVFALDVTDPANFDESNADALVLWEFSDEDDRDLGYTFSQPNIVRMANGRWAAVIGNGYNNSESSGNETAATTSTTGKGYLFIIYTDGPGADGNWDLGTDYIKIEVDSGSVGTPNGLASPAAVDTDGDFKIDLIYAGDLNGNLWRFDVADPAPGNWAVSYGGSPLFVAMDASNNRQPITVRPEVAQHPHGIANGLIVMFGTGRYIDAGDNATSGTQTQTFYGIWDQNGGSNTQPVRGSTTAGANELVKQEIKKEVDINGNSCSNSSSCYRIVSDNPVDLSTGNNRGWYMNLFNSENGNTSNRGEKAVSNPIIRAGRIVFTTLIPSGNVCEFGGDGWLMELSFSTGGRPKDSAVDTNDDGKVDEHDVITVVVDGETITVSPGGKLSEVGIIPRPTILSIPDTGQEKKYTSGSTGDIEIITEKGFTEGRLSWREIR